MISQLTHNNSKQSDYGFHVFVSSILSSHVGVCMPFLSPIKQRSAVYSGFMFPSALSPHPVTQPSSAPWPDVMATSVDPFPLNDTPPPLPTKKYKQGRQKQTYLRELEAILIASSSQGCMLRGRGGEGNL